MKISVFNHDTQVILLRICHSIHNLEETNFFRWNNSSLLRYLIQFAHWMFLVWAMSLHNRSTLFFYISLLMQFWSCKNMFVGIKTTLWSCLRREMFFATWSFRWYSSSQIYGSIDQYLVIATSCPFDANEVGEIIQQLFGKWEIIKCLSEFLIANEKLAHF